MDNSSIVCVSVTNGVREYQGLSKDANKLPHFDELQSGSTCFMLDTSQVYRYHKPTDTWYLL